MAAAERSFTTEQVLRITGLSRRRLAYWLDHRIISADVDEARGRGHVRLWSFRNLVEVSVALWLRDRVSLQLIGKIVTALRAMGTESPLASVRFAVVEGPKRRGQRDHVVVVGDDGGIREPISGQVIFEGVLPLERWSEELERAAARDRRQRRRPGEVERRRGRLGSADVFAGTRVPVEAVRRLHAAGWSDRRILENYPGLTVRDLRSALSTAG